MEDIVHDIDVSFDLSLSNFGDPILIEFNREDTGCKQSFEVTGVLGMVEENESPGIMKDNDVIHIVEDKDTEKEKSRKMKVARYMEKKSKRRWSKVCSYKVRQNFANSRPRVKGRFICKNMD